MCSYAEAVLAADLHVQVPNVAESTLTTPEIPCVFRSKLPTPLSDGLVGDDDPPLRQEFLDIAETQAESVIEVDTMADDFAREPVAAVAGLFCFSSTESGGQRLKLTIHWEVWLALVQADNTSGHTMSARCSISFQGSTSMPLRDCLPRPPYTSVGFPATDPARSSHF